MGEMQAATVSTVRGEVDVAGLGVTLTHEHLFVKNPEFQANFPGLWDPGAGVDLAVAQLDRAYRHGVRTIVDMTVLGQGRDPGLIAVVAARTPVNIVLATGLYVLDGLPQILRYRGPGAMIDMDDPLVDLLETDIRDGIGGTGVRAALVKFACEHPEPDPVVRRVAAAVAEVHSRTGVPVVVHVEPEPPNALTLLALLTDLGVPANRIVFAHAGDITDPAYLNELAGSGAFIGCDRFGMSAFRPDADRIDTVLGLAAAGFLDQILLSHDCPSYIDHLTPQLRAALAPNWSYSHLHADVLPVLRERGFGDVHIATVLEQNPARLLAGSQSPGRTGAR
jgi:phosphotriesterase-related protein